MRYLMLALFTVLLSSCDLNDLKYKYETPNRVDLGNGVVRIEDGNVFCYTHFQNSISCVHK